MTEELNEIHSICIEECEGTLKKLANLTVCLVQRTGAGNDISGTVLIEPQILSLIDKLRKSRHPDKKHIHTLLVYKALAPLALESGIGGVMSSHPKSAVFSEVAPYVRSIAAFDQALEAQRALLTASYGGRLTRAARSIMEGVDRGKVRRERWLPGLNLSDILATASDRYGIATDILM